MKYASLAVPVLLVAILTTVACSEVDETATPTPRSSVDPTATPGPALTPEQTATPEPETASITNIVGSAVAAMLELESAHFEMNAQIEVSGEGLNLEIPVSFEGDFQLPDRAMGTMSIGLVLFEIEFEVIGIGDTLYFKDPTSDEWQSFTGPTPFFADPGELITAELSEVTGIVLEGIEDIDGIPVVHLSGTASAAAFSDLSGEFEANFWIGAEDNLLRRSTVFGELELSTDDPFLSGIASGGVTAGITLDLSDFNKPVTIEAP